MICIHRCVRIVVVVVVVVVIVLFHRITLYVYLCGTNVVFTAQLSGNEIGLKKMQ